MSLVYVTVRSCLLPNYNLAPLSPGEDCGPDELYINKNCEVESYMCLVHVSAFIGGNTTMEGAVEIAVKTLWNN